jgi:lipopolysaccharide assembly protein B
MSDYALLAVLFALLLGLVVGKAWERYKLRDGHWIDRRRLRETPHYMLGLNCLVDNQVDQALEELTRATSTDTDALEIQMILGNLYRQKGQVGRAITVHQVLLQRPDLRPIEHAHVLLCLGLDYKHGGFIDRALETFQEVVRLDPKNRYAFVNLQKLYEDQRQWAEAAAVREKIAALDDDKQEVNNQILGFLRNEVGETLTRAGDDAAATRAFEAALDIDARTAPAYLNLGDMRERVGQPASAVEAWEKLVQTLPDRAYLALDRLERAYQRAGTQHRFGELCARLIDQNPQDWRTRLALSRHLAAAGRHRTALDLLLDALPHNPHGLAIHHEVWKALLALDLDPALVREYMDQTRSAVFYLDPHVCLRCRYRSTELLWQCPQCHEWNTFVEERMSPAKDAAAELGDKLVG